MKRVLYSVVAVVALVTTSTFSGSANTDPHAYFNVLVSSAAHWKSYALRTQAELLTYKNANSKPPAVNYDSVADAARVVVPAFVSMGVATGQPLTAGQTTVELTSTNTQMTSGVAMRLGSEIMTIVRPPGTPIVNNTLTVNRGQHGTIAVPHAAGTQVQLSTNNLQNQVRLPLGTQPGNTYFFVWDGYWTDTYLHSGLTNHKAFQFSSGPKSQLWLEPQTRFDGGGNRIGNFDRSKHVAAAEMRAYLALGGPAVWDSTANGKLGASVTKAEPVTPMMNQFAIEANTWTRFFVRIEQNSSDYTYMDYWVADVNRDAVQIYNRVPMTVPSGTIDKFWLEFNSSQDRLVRGDARDLVSYVRNFVALENPSAVTGLLQRPGAGTPIPPERATVLPAPPPNVRLVTP